MKGKVKKDKKKAEEALKQAKIEADAEKVKIESIISAIGDGICVLDTDFKILYENQIHIDLYGDHVGEPCYEVFQDREEVCEDCPVAISFNDGKVHKQEKSVQTEKGNVYIEITASPLRNGEGKIIAGIEVIRDITKRKKVEEALNATHEDLEKRVAERTKQLRLLQSINTAMNMGVSLKDVLQIAVEGVRDIFSYTACDIFLLDTKKENLILSAISTDSSIIKKIEKLTGLTVLGYRVPLFEGSHFAKVVDEMKVQVLDDTIKVFEDFTDNKKLKLLAGQVAKVARFKSSIMAPLKAENEVIGTIGVASKNRLTEEDARVIGNFASQIALIIRKGQVEEELRDSEERYRSLVENARDIIFTVSHDGKISSINMAAEEITGFKREELIGTSFLPFVHQDDHHLAMGKFQQSMGGKKASAYELRIKTKKGGYIIGEIRSTPQVKDGKVISVLGIIRDITERKKAEEEMKRRLMKFSLSDGSLYMVKEPTTDMSLRAFGDLLNIGYHGLVISRTPEEKFRGHASGNFEFLWLAETSVEKTASVKLKEIKRGIENLTRKNAVLIDRLDYLISKEGFEKTLSFVQELRELAYLSGNIFILSIDPSTIEKRKLRLLEKETLEIELQSKVRLPDDLLEVLSFVYEQNTQGIKPSYSDIGRETGASKPTVRKRIKNLILKGYMTESKKGLYKVVELTDKGRNLFFS